MVGPLCILPLASALSVVPLHVASCPLHTPVWNCPCTLPFALTLCILLFAQRPLLTAVPTHGLQITQPDVICQVILSQLMRHDLL